MADARYQREEMKGWLHKWTNYLKGYQKRWFVLSNGLLSYYRNQMEMQHTCRGTISLVSAVIHTEDSCNFVISNGGTQTFHLRAASEVERQKWVTALELAKSRAVRLADSDDDECHNDIHSDKQELQSMLKTLITKLEELRTCHDLIIKHGAALQRSLTDLEQIDSPAEASSKSKSVNERATLFRITSNAMINSCGEYLNMAQTHGRKWQKLLQHEHDTRLRLEEMVEQLAKQHSTLEARALQQCNSINSPTSANSDDEDDLEFFDAETQLNNEFYVSFPGKAQRVASRPPNNKADSLTDSEIDSQQQPVIGLDSSLRDDISSSGSEVSDDGTGSSSRPRRGHIRVESTSLKTSDSLETDAVRVVVPAKSSNDNDLPASTPTRPPTAQDSNGDSKPRRQRRLAIPERPNHSLNLWSVMKNAIGKELTKIPMPVNFNEPLSMLQRITEDFEYAELLHKAAKIKDSCEQLTYIAAFCVSHYATTSVRTGKPFNPLLGETYECDLGWKSIAEQVSHHPPMLAMHVEGKGWQSWSEFAISSKFRGKYLQVTPIDISHLLFEESGNHYTWRKITTTVHNIIVGRLWIDNCGDLTITNHVTEDKCHLKFIPYSYFSRDSPRKVTGVVVDKDNTPKWVLQGAWDSKMEASKVINSHNSSKGKPVLETSTPKLLWKRVMPPDEYEKMYNMTQLAVQLNEPEEGVAPSDSRNRPDQRAMEQGDWDEANRIKNILEENQRTRRRQREQEAEAAAAAGKPLGPYEPVWFRRENDPQTGNPIYRYNDEYWTCKEKQDWKRCPDIYYLDQE